MNFLIIYIYSYFEYNIVLLIHNILHLSRVKREKKYIHCFLCVTKLGCVGVLGFLSLPRLQSRKQEQRSVRLIQFSCSS